MRPELQQYTEESIATHGHLEFSQDMLATLTAQDAEDVANAYRASALMKLPDHEVVFQEWLRTADPDVWKDLWDGEPVAPYLVSPAFLGDFLGGKGQGAYLICDLHSTDNYFFTPDMLLEKESADYVSAIRDRFLAGGTMTPEQAITLEMSTGPMDIWHFAYQRGVDLERAKKAIASLVEDRIIVHVPKMDHLSSMFDVG